MSETKTGPSKGTAAIYVRSNDGDPRTNGIAAQIDACRSYASNMEFDLHQQVFADPDRSGGRLEGRNGLADLRRLAHAGAFDRILVRGLHVLSRSSSDLGELLTEFTELGIEIHTTGSGRFGRVDPELFVSVHRAVKRDRRHGSPAVEYVRFSAPDPDVESMARQLGN